MIEPYEHSVKMEPVLGAMWIGLVVLASVFYRLSKGKRLFRPRFTAPAFLETWKSGRSMRNFYARHGGARNCLWVAVFNDSICIGVHFPFTLMFGPEIYGLECTIPRSAIL